MSGDCRNCAGSGLTYAKVAFVRLSELSRFCSGRMVITIQNTEKQSERHAACFRAKGTQCGSPGQRHGKMRNECPKPPRGEMTAHPITPFPGFHIRNCRFLGRCPRLSHSAALRQDTSESPSVVAEQKPDQQTPPHDATFARVRTSERWPTMCACKMVGRRGLSAACPTLGLKIRCRS